ncbi:hypothetical protein Clacol_003690 [Clathrus columnatus]|uniref:Mediator of RNA polymerase II transcription subunit 6 n=1 Tax=Clathrus columnatus TaxID=1419009 RepID=A0AAV5A4E9_9AGAM|nr:hypothetical protein Clacol_003690 [Clathrus columnatus]
MLVYLSPNQLQLDTLSHQARGPLTAQNVLDYFAISMFYDKQSNNQVLRMQTEFTGMPVENEAEELRRFTGIEFAVVHEQAPNFFVIQKRERLSPDEASLNCLQSSLQLLSSHKPDFTPRMGFLWPVLPQQTTGETDNSGLKSTDSSLIPNRPVKTTLKKSFDKKQENNSLLLNAMHTTAAQTHKLPIFEVPISNESLLEIPGEFPRVSETPGPSVTQDDEHMKHASKKKRKRLGSHLITSL